MALSSQQHLHSQSRHDVCMIIFFLASISTLLSVKVVDAWAPSSPSIIPSVWRSPSSSSSSSSSLISTTTTTTTTTRMQMAISSCWASEQSRELVERFGAVWEDEVEKVVAYESLQLSPSKDQILDAALAYIQKTTIESRILAGRRWKIRFPSRRTTIGCYGRILAEIDSGRLVIDTIDEDTETTTDPLAPEEKARHNLNCLLERLSTYPNGVWGLEREMMQKAGIENFGKDYGQTK